MHTFEIKIMLVKSVSHIYLMFYTYTYKIIKMHRDIVEVMYVLSLLLKTSFQNVKNILLLNFQINYLLNNKYI